jgi:nicotinate-nucleotide adenylyltransferase
MANRVALFGGTFDPIHFGHLIAARFAAEALGVDRVIYLPCAHPPHKNICRMSSGEHRGAMTKLAIEGEATFSFSDHDLQGDGPVYAIDTVRHFRELLPDSELSWIIGADSLVELSAWREASRLVDLCRMVTVHRPGWDVSRLEDFRRGTSDPGGLSAEQCERLLADVIETPRIDISGSDIRRRVSQGQSIRYLVPEAVREYIERQRLYRTQ